MASGLWVKIIGNHRILRQATVACSREDPREALLEACHELDLPEHISSDALLDVLNAIMSREEFFSRVSPPEEQKRESQ